MDDSHVVWPSKEYEKEFWRRAEEAIAKGESFVRLPELPGSLPALPELPETAQKLLRVLDLGHSSSGLPELQKRYMLLCSLVMRVTIAHAHPCSCKLCLVVEEWLKGNNSSEMLEGILRAP